MMTRAYNREILHRYLEGADVAVVEGVMGLFDGHSGRDEAGSTAQMAKWLDLPLILVVDARAMGRSAAATVLGYQSFDAELSLAGVIFNRVGSQRHEEMLREAAADALPIPVFGTLPRDGAIEIPSRHLGLVTDEDFGMKDAFVDRLALWIEDHMDLGGLLDSLDDRGFRPIPGSTAAKGDVTIGIAVDEAFSFYYPENLRLLEEAGAELVPFSPLRARKLPGGIRGLIFGGGYPELHCRKLSENRSLLEEIREFGLQGGPVYGECGGFMFLMKEITDLDGFTHPMAGLLPMAARMEPGLKALGYREIRTRRSSLLGPTGTRVRGHEFHYSGIENRGPMPERIYFMTDRKQASRGEEGFLSKNVLGSYVHLHWGSNPEVAGHFVDFCRKRG